MKRNWLNLNFKKIVTSLVIAFALFAGSFTGINFNFAKIPQVQASYKQEVSLISNNEFNSYSSTDTPASPSNWTALNPSNSDKIKMGVINVYETIFAGDAEKYELEIADNPGVTEAGKTFNSDNAFYKHLMINSYEGPSRAGYESNTFTLSKDSYYAINVIVKTIKGARASIYLQGLSDENANAKIENISSEDWRTYTIYVATNNFNNENVTLQLWLGGQNDSQASSGAVFFHKVNVIRYSQSTYSLELYYANLLSGQTKQFVNVDLNGTINTSPVLNANFEDEVTDQNIINGFKTIYNDVDENEKQILRVIPTDSSYNDEIHTVKGIINPKNNNSPNNRKVLFMYNETENSLGIESSDITIKQQTYYKISVWAKSNAGIGNGATIKLVEKNVNNDENFEALTASLTVNTTETANVATNNWTQYSFFVEGHPLKDTVVNLQLWLGTKESPTVGYVFFDDITLQEIKYAYYSTGSSLSNSTTFTFNTNNNQFLVPNGNFNLTNNEQSQVIYPLTPRNWSLSTTDNNFNIEDAISGVVNTKEDKFNEFKQTLLNSSNINHQVTVSNPGLTPLLKTINSTIANTSNNVLVIGNPYNTNQTYKSDSINLTANSYYKVNFSINTQYTTHNSVGAKFKINGPDYTIYQLANFDTNGQWETYSVYLATSEQINITIELSLIDTTGFVFFDDIEITTINETIFNNAQANKLPKSAIVNFNVENFGNYYKEGVVNTPYNWTGTSYNGDENVVFGIANNNDFGSFGLVGIPSPDPQFGKDVLVIGSIYETYYTATSLNKFNLEAGKYYKITVYVKTYGINQESNLQVVDSNNNPYLPGASIKLTQYNESFTAINTELLSENNQNNWVNYEFYVNPENAITTGIEISLGYKNALTAGYVFVDSISIETMEKSQYEQALGEIKNSKTALALTQLETEEETEQPGKEFEGNKFDWLLVSSLLLAVSLLIALIGTMLRRYKFSIKPKKRIKTSYDRRRTIEVEMNKRERIEFRRNIINELKLEFDEIDKEIEEYLQDYNTKLEQLKERAKQRREKFENLSKAIIVEITDLNEKHNQELQTIQDEQLKQQLQEKHNKRIAKLKAKEERIRQKGAERERHYKALQEKRERYLQQQQYRKQLIQQEIERIEREIEEIAREEEIMWSEYRKAKEQAKKAKMEYYAQKRAEKRMKKQQQNQTQSSDTQTTNSENENSENN